MSTIQFHTELLQFWFGPARDYWFGCPHEFDALIKAKYESILLAIDTADFPQFTSTDEIVATIILFDQFSRHMYRGLPKIIRHYDSKARHILENSGILDHFHELDLEYRCFALMPWRHTFDPVLLQYCLNMPGIDTPHPMCRRFRQATLKALSKYNTTLVYDHALLEPITINPAILDPQSARTFIMHDLLSRRDTIFDNFINGIPKKYHTGPLIVSVSGGVDSMVCLVLTSLAFPTATIVAVSINYMNRAEQADELCMVTQVCRALGISHYVREITEVKRTRDADRDFYETFTRDIRFDTYKHVGAIIMQNWIGNGENRVPVILGHNQDDALENVFSNIKKRRGYNNLFGMDMEGDYNGVTILRPLLMTPKSQLVAYAQANSVPYTYDSTPEWCERGKMRDQLIPFLQNFDAALLPGLIELVSNYTQIYDVYAKSIPTIKYAPDSCEVECRGTIYLFDYWKRIFTSVALHYGVPFAKNKSVTHFVTQIKQGNMSRLTISKHMVGQMMPDSVLVIHMYL